MKKIALFAELIIISFTINAQNTESNKKTTFEYEAHANGVFDFQNKEFTPLLYGMWYLSHKEKQFGLWGFSYFEPGSFENSIGPRFSFINNENTQFEVGLGYGYDFITHISAITSYAWFDNVHYESYAYYEFGSSNYYWSQFFLQRKITNRFQLGIAYQTSVGYGLKFTAKSKNEYLQYYVHPAYENNEYKVLFGIMITN